MNYRSRSRRRRRRRRKGGNYIIIVIYVYEINPENIIPIAFKREITF
jgi:hypothetical protein